MPVRLTIKRNARFQRRVWELTFHDTSIAGCMQNEVCIAQVLCRRSNSDLFSLHQQESSSVLQVALLQSETIHRALDPLHPLLHHMGVTLSGLDSLVFRRLLNGESLRRPHESNHSISHKRSQEVKSGCGLRIRSCRRYARVVDVHQHFDKSRSPR